MPSRRDSSIPPLTEGAAVIPGVVEDLCREHRPGPRRYPRRTLPPPWRSCARHRRPWLTGEVLDLNGGAHLKRYPNIHQHLTKLMGHSPPSGPQDGRDSRPTGLGCTDMKTEFTLNQKRALGVATAVALLFGAYFLRRYLILVVIAAIVAYLFTPVYNRLRTRLNAGLSTTLNCPGRAGHRGDTTESARHRRDFSGLANVDQPCCLGENRRPQRPRRPRCRPSQ